VFTGGEPFGATMYQWVAKSLAPTVNEGYGQTECNVVAGNCSAILPVRPGSFCKALPGHTVSVRGDSGEELVGEEGEPCVLAPDPVLFLGYWRRDQPWPPFDLAA
jgi:acetyl-CoA synthetase